MSDVQSIRKALRARWNLTRREAVAIATAIESADPETVDGETLAELRDRCENLLQAFHEANAYRNSYDIIRERK